MPARYFTGRLLNGITLVSRNIINYNVLYIYIIMLFSVATVMALEGVGGGGAAVGGQPDSREVRGRAKLPQLFSSLASLL